MDGCMLQKIEHAEEAWKGGGKWEGGGGGGEDLRNNE